jgi:hypothetical protein
LSFEDILTVLEWGYEENEPDGLRIEKEWSFEEDLNR